MARHFEDKLRARSGLAKGPVIWTTDTVYGNLVGITGAEAEHLAALVAASRKVASSAYTGDDARVATVDNREAVIELRTALLDLDEEDDHD